MILSLIDIDSDKDIGSATLLFKMPAKPQSYSSGEGTGDCPVTNASGTPGSAGEDSFSVNLSWKLPAGGGKCPTTPAVMLYRPGTADFLAGPLTGSTYNDKNAKVGNYIIKTVDSGALVSVQYGTDKQVKFYGIVTVNVTQSQTDGAYVTPTGGGTGT